MTGGSSLFSAAPETNLEDLFPELDHLESKLDQMKSILQPESKLNLDEKIKLSESFGRNNLKASLSTEDEIKQELTDLAKHLEVLVNYISEKFQPLRERLALCVSYGKMEFDLLKYYFKKDQIVVTQSANGLSSANDPPIAVKVKTTQMVVIDPQSTSTLLRLFKIHGEGYEWNGIGYSQRSVTIECHEFEGAKDMSSLPFLHLTSEMKDLLTTRGKLYTTFSGTHFFSYDGARVMVDRVGWNDYQSALSEAINLASATTRRKVTRQSDPRPQDVGQRTDGENVQHGSKGLGIPRTRASNEEIPQIEKEYLHFLPANVYGFDLENKCWISMYIEKLGPVSFDEGAWDHLVLDSKVKTLIKGLVEVTRKQNDSSKALIHDVIRGKGGGLVCVLYGPPGTGKTLTAEAVAEILRRPLYIAGATELTTNPSELEKTLKQILNLATAWDAVVLIDEADVFLEQRSLNELQRNTLVSAVLRLLEYHRGVLFLTTNRVRAFDYAFMSRISIAIKYPELDHASRFAIWSKFFALAGYEVKDSSDSIAGLNSFTRGNVEELASKPFNGRTIKNLVRTAQALALASNSPLTLEHINIVVESQEKFLDEFAGMKI
ncbi:P-loop containing nucleoside triphosphate hydrolase protein [Dendrothele bispora CBS 962.96]|uniref:P-loop containing nucleoside triphosphate hydrolase protein n=1 Tax=Dendrothele bispora (strain CBS 962.96) TaxID=1314807 RepID=A0A4S8LBI7_DENBC|nr:P-loop containing nucleoside triphosphate hydrolase protein [Dendrothele bispora CBS 962.96]